MIKNVDFFLRAIENPVRNLQKDPHSKPKNIVVFPRAYFYENSFITSLVCILPLEKISGWVYLGCFELFAFKNAPKLPKFTRKFPDIFIIFFKQKNNIFLANARIYVIFWLFLPYSTQKMIVYASIHSFIRIFPSYLTYSILTYSSLYHGSDSLRQLIQC